MAKPPKKFVYVIGPSGGPCKIGIADDVGQRRSILNVGNPKYLRIWHSYEANTEGEAIEIEKQLHYDFKDHHIRGEWFELTENKIEQIKQSITFHLMFNRKLDDWSLERVSCDEFTPLVCRRARSLLFLTESELADKSFINLKTLQNFENGSTTPNIQTLESLREAIEAEGVQFVREQTGKPLTIIFRPPA